MARRNRQEEARAERRMAARDAGWKIVRDNPLLHRLIDHTGPFLSDDVKPPVPAWAVVDSWGRIAVDEFRDAEPQEWAWVLTHLLLHLGLGHLDPARMREAGVEPGGPVPDSYATACCVSVERFRVAVPVGWAPYTVPALPGGDELELAARWAREGVPPDLRTLGVNGTQPCFVYQAPSPDWKPATDIDWGSVFGRGLSEAAGQSIVTASEQSGGVQRKKTQGPWDKALNWFVSSYPLLGALAAGLTVVDDAETARTWDISIAAVSASAGEIYINPMAQLTGEEWRFVLGHEMLHAALRHDLRVEWRDPELFNVACDFVINDWLVEMGVGHMPDGLLYDPQLRGLSAEAVYDTLTTDLRRARKLRTIGGKHGDVRGDWRSDPHSADRRGSRFANEPGGLEDFYRRALTTGLAYHDSSRGLVPAGLVEEIRALEHPPLSWDAKLARWFDEHVRSPEPRRSYSRPSRRQSATPDIPRAGRYLPEEIVPRCTFGVVLDTSGSMDRELLGKALGAIAAYASARDVPYARVVFCDAAAYDAGYLPVTDIAGKVQVRGRGGTVLQPGVDLLQRAGDFPADGPVLVITDGECDRVTVRREHAFLVPQGARLPFTPRGPVFRVV